MHKESMLSKFEPSLTAQSFLESTKIENIMKQYLDTGVMPFANMAQQFVDVSNSPASFLDMHNLLSNANDIFNTLPENIVSRFNGPVELLKFLNDEENRAEAQKLGLLAPNSPLSASAGNGSEGSVTEPSATSPGKEGE